MKACIFGPVLDPNHITACSTSTDDMQHCAVQCSAARYVDFLFTSNLTDQKKSHTQHTAAAAPPVSQLDWLLSRACTAKSTRPQGRCSTRHCLGQRRGEYLVRHCTGKQSLDRALLQLVGIASLHGPPLLILSSDVRPCPSLEVRHEQRACCTSILAARAPLLAWTMFTQSTSLCTAKPCHRCKTTSSRSKVTGQFGNCVIAPERLNRVKTG